MAKFPLFFFSLTIFLRTDYQLLRFHLLRHFKQMISSGVIFDAIKFKITCHKKKKLFLDFQINHAVFLALVKSLNQNPVKPLSLFFLLNQLISHHHFPLQVE